MLLNFRHIAKFSQVLTHGNISLKFLNWLYTCLVIKEIEFRKNDQKKAIIH